MEVREFYNSIGGGYEDAVGRLVTDERIIKFVKKYPLDESMPQLLEAMEAGDYAAAFSAAHTLKGVTANLSLTELNIAAEKITEMLRNEMDIDGAVSYLPILKMTNDKVIELIEQL